MHYFKHVFPTVASVNKLVICYGQNANQAVYDGMIHDMRQHFPRIEIEKHSKSSLIPDKGRSFCNLDRFQSTNEYAVLIIDDMCSDLDCILLWTPISNISVLSYCLYLV
jgi:hypothetical protein